MWWPEIMEIYRERGELRQAEEDLALITAVQLGGKLRALSGTGQ